MIIIAYACWLLLWAFASVIISALVARPRDALAILMGLWMITIILLPRALPEAASAQNQLATKIETEIALHRDLLEIGDSHDPDDPYFNDFRDEVLDRYGVRTVEELPVQYAGLVAIEGERLTTQIYADAAQRQAARENAGETLPITPKRFSDISCNYRSRRCPFCGSSRKAGEPKLENHASARGG